MNLVRFGLGPEYLDWFARLEAAMQRVRHKQPRLTLNFEEYSVLRAQVLVRDGYRCQDCSSSKDLQVHHIIKRGHLGDDTQDNLITLCAVCHRRRHIS
jgi:5-methylcytosine-specific restriction endonuclease McrA